MAIANLVDSGSSELDGEIVKVDGVEMPHVAAVEGAHDHYGDFGAS